MNIINWLELKDNINHIELLLSNVLKENHIQLNEFYTLYYLSKAPQYTEKAVVLQHKIGLSQSAYSRLISRLEGLDLIQKATVAGDKRFVSVQMTEKGSRCYESRYAEIGQILSDFNLLEIKN